MEKEITKDQVAGIQKALGELPDGEHWCPESWPCPVCEAANESEEDNE